MRKQLKHPQSPPQLIRGMVPPPDSLLVQNRAEGSNSVSAGLGSPTSLNNIAKCGGAFPLIVLGGGIPTPFVACADNWGALPRVCCGGVPPHRQDGMASLRGSAPPRFKLSFLYVWI